MMTLLSPDADKGEEVARRGNALKSLGGQAGARDGLASRVRRVRADADRRGVSDAGEVS